MQTLIHLLAGALALGALAMTGMVSCTSDGRRSDPGTPAGDGPGAGAVDPTDAAAFAALLDGIQGHRVIYIGEIHDRYDHHRNQLAVIRGLHERGVALAIGMESFQEPFQPCLDAYLAGRLDEKEMLRKTEYFSRWRFDFRLYRDILVYARTQGIPLVALNAPTEMVEAVSRNGIAGLSAEYRALLPARVAPADQAYEDRLRTAFRLHGKLPEERFERFMEVQSVWDEYMARRAADYLAQNPARTLVVLVGSAHVLHDAAIPGRLRQYRPVDQAVVVTRPFDPLPGVAPDYILAAQDIEIPSPGHTGLSLREDGGRVTVQEVTPKGAAQAADLRVGDRILSIAGNAVARLDDVRIALVDSAPGDRLPVVVERTSAGHPRRMTKILTLL